MSMPAKEEINAPTPGDINQVREWLTEHNYTTDPMQAVQELKELVNAHARQTSEGLEVEEGYSEAFTKLSALINSFRFALAEEQRRQEHDLQQVKMPHSFGLRARTRHLFSRNFKEHGPIHLKTYLTPYKVGDIVDIKANPGEQRGMPHKFYHGRTGIVFNVAPRAVGVIVYKIIRSRYIEKRVNLRIEHVKHSKCREEFLRRVKSNRQALSEAKQKGERVNLKRSPKQPREGQMLKSKTTPETIAPIAYDTYI